VTARSSSRIRVLAVDAASDAAASTAAALEDADEQLTAVYTTSVRDALDRVDDVDCVVSAYDLPERSGVEFLEAVRETRPSLPVFLFTEAERDRVAAAALAAGATDYVRKGEDAVQYALLANRITNAVEADDGTASTDDDSPLPPELQVEDESNLLDQIFEQVPAHLFVKDREGRHIKLSAYLTDDTDDNNDNDDLLIPAYTREHILGKRDYETADAEHARQGYEDDMHVIETGEPIIQQEEYADDFDEWDLTSKVPWRGPDGEIRGLIGITQRITERKRAQQRLQRQNERLEEFASVISHDLRNPLNVALGRLEMAQRDHDSPHLDDVAKALGRMDDLIDDVLTAARSGEPVEETEAVALADLAQECWTTTEKADASLVVETDLTVRADPGRLRQLLANLFRNAVEHGSTSRQPPADDAVEHGSTGNRTGSDDAVEHGGDGVTITVGDCEGGFFVADDGPGIPEDRREDVFDRGFTTADDGTGFGLSIVEEAAKAHGWTVDVTESTNGGARFEVTGVETE